MAKQSYVATSQGQTQVQQAIARIGLTQMELAGQVGLKTRSSISKLINGRRVERKIFQRICQALQVDWREVADLPPPDNVVSPKHHESMEPQADLFQEQRLELLLLNFEAWIERLDSITQQLQSQLDSLALDSRNTQNLDEESLAVESPLEAKLSRLASLPVDKPALKKLPSQRSTMDDLCAMQIVKQQDVQNFDLMSNSLRIAALPSASSAPPRELESQERLKRCPNEERAQLPTPMLSNGANQGCQPLLEARGPELPEMRKIHADEERAQLPLIQDKTSRRPNPLKKVSDSVMWFLRPNKAD